MPMYEYRCKDCGEVFEELVRQRTRDDEVECPSCGAYHSEKKLSAFAVRGGTSSHCGPTGSS